MDPTLRDVALGALQVVIAITVAAVFLIALLVGFSVVFNVPKLRKSGGRTLTYRSLGELVGEDDAALGADEPVLVPARLDTLLGLVAFAVAVSFVVFAVFAIVAFVIKTLFWLVFLPIRIVFKLLFWILGAGFGLLLMPVILVVAARSS